MDCRTLRWVILSFDLNPTVNSVFLSVIEWWTLNFESRFDHNHDVSTTERISHLKIAQTKRRLLLKTYCEQIFLKFTSYVSVYFVLFLSYYYLSAVICGSPSFQSVSQQHGALFFSLYQMRCVRMIRQTKSVSILQLLRFS